MKTNKGGIPVRLLEYVGDSRRRRALLEPARRWSPKCLGQEAPGEARTLHGGRVPARSQLHAGGKRHRKLTHSRGTRRSGFARLASCRRQKFQTLRR